MLLLVAAFLTLASQGTSTNSGEAFDSLFAIGTQALTSGRPDDAIPAFKRCLELRPNDSLSGHQLACCYSRKGQVAPAFEWLQKSIEWGALDGHPGLLLSDTDLDPIRTDPRFESFLQAALKKAAEPFLPAAYIDWTGGHRMGVNTARFSPDGSKIASASMDGWARIWDSASGELLVLLVGHRGAVKLCAWLDGGRQLLTSGTDFTLRFWDARTGDLLRILRGPFMKYPGALGPDDRLVLSTDGGRGARLIDSHSGQGLSIDHGSEVYGVAFSPDGAHFATASADGSTRLFDVDSRECLATNKSGSAAFDVVFSPDRLWIVTGAADGAVRWLDPNTLKLVRSFRAHRAEVNNVEFRPDGKELLTTSVDRTARVWNAENGSPRFTLSGHSDAVNHGNFSRDGERILTPSSDGTVRVWDDRNGDLILTLDGRGTLQHRAVAFSPDAARLLTFDDRGTREWDPRTARELEPSGSPLVVRVRSGPGGTPYEATSMCWSTEDVTLEIEGARTGVDAVFLAPGQRVVYSADWDERGRLWDANSGRLLRDLGPLSRDGNLTTEVSRRVSASFSPDGAMLATAQHADGAVHLWEASTGEEIGAFPGEGECAVTVAFDSSGELLAASRQTFFHVDIWNIVAGERVRSLLGHSNWVSTLAFRSDGQVLATGSLDGTVRLWNIRDGACLNVLRQPFPVSVCGVAFAPDGKRIFAATKDHRVLLWEAQSGRLHGTIVPGEEPGDWLAFAPSNHYHGTSKAIGRARLVQGAISYPLSCFAAALENPEKVAGSFAGVDHEMPKLPTPPTLVVAEPVERTSVVAERSVHVQAMATEPLAGLAGIEVVQDEVSVPAALLGRSLTQEDNERLARLDLRLPIRAGAAETRITLQAVSARGIKSRPQTFVVRYEPPKRELFVLALGVADYADDTLDLAYPVQDVEGLIARLEAQESELFNDVHVERRVDHEVTAAEILRLREEFLLRAKPDDTLLVFVAGHGVRSDTGEYWFLTSDTTPTRPFGGIQRSTLESLVTWDKLHATKRVLLLDTCHSGSAFGQGSRGERGIAFQQSEVDTLLERSSGLYILAATSDDGFAREQEGNGLFTRALLDGLEGAADSGDFGDHDGTVGIDELMHFARYAVLERSEGRQRPTFPKIEGGENFPLARVAR